jgi:hypothetical protein
MILIRAGLDLKLEVMKKDQHGRLLIMQCTIQGSPFQITNQYVPNRQKKNEYVESIIMPKLSEEDKLTSEEILALDEITESLNLPQK